MKIVVSRFNYLIALYKLTTIEEKTDEAPSSLLRWNLAKRQ